MPDQARTAKTKGRQADHDPTAAYLRYFEGRYTVAENRENENSHKGNGRPKAENQKSSRPQKGKRKGR